MDLDGFAPFCSPTVDIRYTVDQQVLRAAACQYSHILRRSGALQLPLVLFANKTSLMCNQQQLQNGTIIFTANFCHCVQTISTSTNNCNALFCSSLSSSALTSARVTIQYGNTLEVTFLFPCHSPALGQIPSWCRLGNATGLKE